MLTEVTFNGVDVSSKLAKWEITEKFGQSISEAKITVRKSIFLSVPTLRNGHSVTIKRGTTTATDQFVFEGVIDNITKAGALVIIHAKDLMATLVNKSVTKSYDGVAFPGSEAEGSDIATSLIETFGGMTASVVATPSSLTLKKFICRGTDVFSRLQILADIYDYMVYYDPDDSKVHFEPKGYTAYTTALTVGGNVKNIPTWQFDNSQLVNELVVKGAVQEVQDIETFNGDNTASQVFTLAKKPISVQVEEEVASVWVLKTPGVTGSTSSFDYEVDKENKTITASSSWTPASGTDNVRATYTNAIPVPVQVDDLTSQANYGIKHAEKFFDDIQTVSDAEVRGQGWLAKYSEPFVQVSLQLAHSLIDIDVGQTVSVIDSVNNETRDVIVNSIKKQFPHKADLLECGDKEWRLAEWGKFTIERIRRLEENIAGDQEILVQIKSFPKELGFTYRYLRAISYDWSGTDRALYDNPDFGAYGRKYREASVVSAPTADNDFRVVWPERTYVEDFRDTDFFDASASNATWDTTNKQVSF